MCNVWGECGVITNYTDLELRGEEAVVSSGQMTNVIMTHF